jgi:hypothetical protein
LPVPVKLTTIFPPVRLLEIVNCPVYEPVVKGANWMVRVADCPGFKVVGNVIPETENPVPEIDAALTVTADVPDAVSVMDCAAVEFSTIAPNGTLVALTLSEPTPVPSCMANVCETPPAVAVIVAD